MQPPRELTQEEREWIDEWLPRLPMRVAREAVYEVLAGLIKPATLRHADCMGFGPEIRYKIGKKVVYDMRVLLEWIVRKEGITRLLDLEGMASVGTARPRPRGARKDADGHTAASSRGSCAA